MKKMNENSTERELVTLERRKITKKHFKMCSTLLEMNKNK